jgi:hypothetical protein
MMAGARPAIHVFADGQGVVILGARRKKRRIMKSPLKIPHDLQAAIEAGSLTKAQVWRLIGIESTALGLSTEDAVRRAESGTLPRNPIADDLALLVAAIHTSSSS